MIKMYAGVTLNKGTMQKNIESLLMKCKRRT